MRVGANLLPVFQVLLLLRNINGTTDGDICSRHVLQLLCDVQQLRNLCFVSSCIAEIHRAVLPLIHRGMFLPAQMPQSSLD